MRKDLILFQKIANTLLESEIEKPVIKPLNPNRLNEILDLTLDDEPIDTDRFEKAISGLVLNTPRTSTDLFFNQLFGGRKGKAVLGELLSVLLNSSMYTYKVGGPMVVMEKEILDKIASLIGFGRDYGGTMAPGGSMTNMMAMLMARDRLAPAVRFHGSKATLIAYTSTESHYSISKNAAFTGIGRDNVRYISTNDRGQMRSSELKEKILEDLSLGYQPFFINVTAGTTVLGAFDPIEEMADIAEEFGLWLHVDGAFGGSVLFSDRYRHLLKGVERSDSFSLNAHKTLGVPLLCSMIWAKNKQDMYESFSNDASYLYQTANDELNPGKISLQCGRRNDALKFWALWKSIGTKGLAEAVDHQFELAQMARDYIRSNPDYQLYNFDKSVCVCFNYKGIEPKKLCNLLYEEGEIVIGFGKFKNEIFVRLVIVNFDLNEESIRNFFKRLEKFVEDHEF